MKFTIFSLWKITGLWHLFSLQFVITWWDIGIVHGTKYSEQNVTVEILKYFILLFQSKWNIVTFPKSKCFALLLLKWKWKFHIYVYICVHVYMCIHMYMCTHTRHFHFHYNKNKAKHFDLRTVKYISFWLNYQNEMFQHFYSDIIQNILFHKQFQCFSMLLQIVMKINVKIL